MIESIELGEVPFFWRIKKTVDQQPVDVPTRLPFTFSFLDDLQLVIQKRDPVVLKWLERVYKEDANVGYLQEGHALAESYGGEFVEFFRRASTLLPQLPSSAVDIGCGGVYLLQKVREQGLAVKGIDPSPVTAAAGRKAGIEIITDFYPSPLLTEHFDVLFHYDVLEHVEDPVAFLRAHQANLSPNGALIFAVPDCSHHIELGDVSMLLHEHLNYFDCESLERVVRAAGFEPLLLEPASNGGVLLCCAVPQANRAAPPTASVKDDSKFRVFRTKAQTALRNFEALADESGRGELGLYVPLRAFPYLGSLSSNVRLRFFDDDPGLHGRFYDGFDVPIESLQNLIAKPMSQVLICSLVFGAKIAGRVRAENPDQNVVLWNELFE